MNFRLLELEEGRGLPDSPGESILGRPLTGSKIKLAVQAGTRRFRMRHRAPVTDPPSVTRIIPKLPAHAHRVEPGLLRTFCWANGVKKTVETVGLLEIRPSFFAGCPGALSAHK